MNETSSRTPEGEHHQCNVCGHHFRLSISMAGDTCCPRCNALAWPTEGVSGELTTIPGHRSVQRIREIRLRDRDTEDELRDKVAEVMRHLKANDQVCVSSLYAGRQDRHRAAAHDRLRGFVEKIALEEVTNGDFVEASRCVRSILTTATHGRDG